MGARGEGRVKNTFGRDSMAERLDDIVREIVREEKRLLHMSVFSLADLFGLVAVVGCLFMAVVVTRNYFWLDKKYGW
jgi:hypothetical protein